MQDLQCTQMPQKRCICHRREILHALYSAERRLRTQDEDMDTTGTLFAELLQYQANNERSKFFAKCPRRAALTSFSTTAPIDPGVTAGAGEQKAGDNYGGTPEMR